MVLKDAIWIAKAKKPVADLGVYEQIIPKETSYFERFSIWERAWEIFNKLGGLK